MKRTCLILVMVLASACTKEQSTGPNPPDGSASWELIGTELPSPVTSLCVTGQGLVAATVEETLGHLTASLWCWSDSTWEQVATPLAGQVDVMKWYGGVLVVGGSFEIDGEPPIRGLAQWDGSSWLGVGDPLEDPGGYCDRVDVRSMALWRDRLVIGGWFNDGNLAAWDGAVLEIIPCSVDVSALTVWRDTLLVGGWGQCGDILCPNSTGLIARDGNRWSDFGNWGELSPGDCPPPQAISSLLATDEGVIVTGILPEFADPSIESIALWTGHDWRPMGSVGGTPGLLLLADSHLVLVAWKGNFGPSQILCWDGESWIPVGSALGGYVSDLLVFEDDLIAGGDFTGSVARMSLDRLE